MITEPVALHIVIYKSYNEWRSTQPFKTEAEAQKHIDTYIQRPEKDYNTHIEVRRLFVEGEEQ